MKITDVTIKRLAAEGRTTTFWDDGLKGFGLRCTPPSRLNPEGARSWVVEYRPGTGGRRVAKRRLVLGSASKLKTADARKAAIATFDAVRRGEDPLAARKVSRVAATIRELVLGTDEMNPGYQTAFASTLATDGRPATKRRRAIPKEAAKTGKWKVGTSRNYEIYWRRHMLGEIGDIKARDLTRADVSRLQRKIAARHPVTANRCMEVLRAFYTWAMAEGLVPDSMKNPAVGFARCKEVARDYYLTADDLKRLGDALGAAETVGIPWPESKGGSSKHLPAAELQRTRIEPGAAAAIRLLLFTGARLREILNLRWEHVDFGRGLLFLPDSKSGKKTVVLGAAALEVIEGLRITTNGAYVIPGADPDTPRHDLKRPWALVTRAAGLSGVRIHDVRHTFASFGASGGLGLTIIGGLLGHASVTTTQRYAHLIADPLRRAADLIAGDIAAAMRGPAMPRAERSPHA